ncbi:MAG TPA: FtsX-like permease family protein, partial [Acidimicrobiales bacterium]|nr:FtsX-like permease family protein [Acidimicrobiales bacterium]
MIRTTLRGLVAHKLRLLTTALAVMLGVAFMAGTLVLTDTLGQSFDELVADVNDGVDAQVRGTATFGEGGAAVRDRLDADLLDTVIAADGVAAAAGSIEGFAQIVADDGTILNGSGMGAPSLGVLWTDIDELNPLTLVEGTGPATDDEVVIDRASANELGVSTGDTITVNALGGAREHTVSGIATFGDADSPLGASIVAFTEAAGQAALAAEGAYDGISVVAADGVSEDELVASLDAALAAERRIEVITGTELVAENQDAVAQNIGFFNTFLLTFAVVALAVGAFIIFNTFSIIVAQRSRELAVLRAIGASRRQVMASVVIEAVVVGVVASAVGLVLGIGVANGLTTVLDSLGFDLPAQSLVIEAGSMVTALVIGAVITVASAVVPARRASRIPPVAAMRDVAIDTSAGSHLRIGTGLLVAAAGALALTSGLAGATDQPVALVGLGAALIFLGVATLGPVIARPLSRVLGWPAARLHGVPGTIARENAARSPKRTAATASALMIGVGLVGFITVMASSIRASIDEVVGGAIDAEYVVSSDSLGFGGIDPALAGLLAELPEVAAVTGVGVDTVEVDGTVMGIAGVDGPAAEATLDLDVTAGSLADLGPTGIAVADQMADERGWGAGDIVSLRFPDGTIHPFEVSATFDNDSLGDVFIGRDALESRGLAPYDIQVLVSLADGVDLDPARTAIESVTAGFPNAEVQTAQEFADAQAATLDPLFGLVYALLALAVIIALLGIANTLALSIFERTRELGLLRAVGMSRSQLRHAVRYESVIIALLGTGLGLVIGVGFGAAVMRAMSEEGVSDLVVPAGPFAVIT